MRDRSQGPLGTNQLVRVAARLIYFPSASLKIELADVREQTGRIDSRQYDFERERARLGAGSGGGFPV